MMNINHIILTLIVFTPLAGALLLALLPDRGKTMPWAALAVTLITFGLTLHLPFHYSYAGQPGAFQFEQNIPWIATPAIHYHIGVDGLSMWLMVLTGLLAPLGVLISWRAIGRRKKLFYVLFLLQQVAMMGIFVSLDMFLYYAFWEMSLVPMTVLIATFGRSERRRFAAIKYFLYAFIPSALLLVAMLWIYAQTGTFDLPKLAALAAGHAISPNAAALWIASLGFLLADRLELLDRRNLELARAGQRRLGTQHPPRLAQASLGNQQRGVNPGGRQRPLAGHGGEAVVMVAAIRRQRDAQLPQVVLAGGQTRPEAAGVQGRPDHGGDEDQDGGRSGNVDPAGAACPGRRRRVRAELTLTAGRAKQAHRSPYGSHPGRGRLPQCALGRLPPRSLREHELARALGQAGRRQPVACRPFQNPQRRQLPPDFHQGIPVLRVRLQARRDSLHFGVVQSAQEVSQDKLSSPITHGCRSRGGERLSQLLDRRMQSALDGADGNAEHVGRLTVLQSLKIDQHDYLAGWLRKLIHHAVDPVALLAGLGFLDGPPPGAVEQLHERPRLAFRPGAHLPVQAGHPVPAAAAPQVDCLVGCHGIQPWPQLPLGFELVALQVDLEEGLLEDVFGKVGIAEVVAEVTVKLLLVAADQLLEGRAIPVVAVGHQEFLVGPRRPGVRNRRARPLVVERAAHF